MPDVLINVPATPQPRTLRFKTIDDALTEAERLLACERDGRLARAGNWTLGQALGHLATWASFPFEGYPASVRPPLPVRLVLRLMRRRVLSGAMPKGMKIGRLPGGTLGLDVVPTDEGIRRFRDALQRLRTSCPTCISPVFGKLTHEQWVQLNLRHAELHLGFQVPRDA